VRAALPFFAHRRREAGRAVNRATPDHRAGTGCFEAGLAALKGLAEKEEAVRTN